ncbi:MAG: hypothetical protein FD180_3133 [Planctomycetota bacterium]|nr:MAG: hypothetical protein FD180_3133 [Planctomycetota bacterium]
MRFVAALLMACVAGCGKPATPAPPSSSGPASPATPGWRASLDGATVPEVPASGKICGESFTVNDAEFEDGRLTLKEGGGGGEMHFTVFVMLDRGSIPENRTWNVKADKEFGHPNVSWMFAPGGGRGSNAESVSNGYSMKLEFGKESGKKLPGKIWLCMPGETKNFVAGTFVATVKGFILRNGEADRTEDSLELLEWLADERLRKENSGKQVEVTKLTWGIMWGGAKGSGGQDVEWKLDGVNKGWLKFRFAKENGSWGVSKVWPGEQIPEAHPEKAPAQNDATPEAVKFLAAVELERILAGKIAHVRMGSAPTLKSGVAACCEATWQVEGEESWIQKALLFKWTDAGWAFDRMLAEGERFDAGTGAVEKK